MPKVTCILPQCVQLLVCVALRLRARGNRDTRGHKCTGAFFDFRLEPICVSPVGTSAVLVPGALATSLVGTSSAFVATCFGFWPRFFGDAGVIGSSSSISCDGVSTVFGVGAFLQLAHVFVFSDGADRSMATDLVFLVEVAGGIVEVEV
jgi:hypothetical protein